MIAPKSALPKSAVEARRFCGRPGVTLIQMFVGLLILGVVVALFLPAPRRAREAARRTQCKNNLKQIGLALHNYHDVWGTFPPACTFDADGKPLHSWRTLLLPYLDQAALYNKIDFSKAWDDPANAEVFKTLVHTYSCPSSPSPQGQTAYLAVVGEKSVLGQARSKTIKEITDGTANTLLVIEVPYEYSVQWMEPRDADEALVLASFRPDVKKTQHAGGDHVLMADGTVRFLSQNIPPETLRGLLSASGGEKIGDY